MSSLDWKRFLAIPILIFLYMVFVDNLVSSNISAGSAGEAGGQEGGTVNVGVGHSVAVSVTRPYIFGLIRLPVYSSTLGDIGIYHEIFFYSLIGLTVFLILMDRLPIGRKLRIERRINMTKYVVKAGVKVAFDWKKLLKAALLGLGIGIVSFMLSGDGGPSVALGLLLIYLEFKLK